MAIPRSTSSHQPLWRDLADGSAGFGVRLMVTLALAAFLTGLTCGAAYYIALVFPQWNRGLGGAYVAPSDDLLIALALLAGTAFLGAAGWIWLRGRRTRAFLGPALATLGIAVVTAITGVVADDSLTGDSELVVFGLIMVAAAAVVVIWLNAWRRYVPGRPTHDATDGLLDVRCPECGYRMVGLSESRCPECGKLYTLDELLARQEFARTARATTPRSV